MIEVEPAIDSMSDAGLRPVRILMSFQIKFILFFQDLQGSVQLKNVQFVYPTRQSVKVLQGLSVSVQPGHTLV
jgi:ABC-type multidrug transport system fused ATPase/permease subunit